MTIASSDISFNKLNIELGRTSTNALSINDSNISSLLLGGAVNNQALTTMVGKSTNGAVWTDVWYGAQKKGVAFSSRLNRYVVITWSRFIWTSTDGMASFTKVDTGVAGGFNAIVTLYNGNFVACGASGTGSFYTSSDGINWTAVSNPSSTPMVSIAASGSTIVACGGYYVVTSTNSGVSWTTTQSSAGYSYKSVATSGSLWVVVGYFGGGKPMAYSPEGLTWTNVGTGLAYTNQVDLVTYMASAGTWIATGPNLSGGMIYWSGNGTTWGFISGPSGYSNNWASLANDGTNFIMNGAIGGSSYRTVSSVGSTSTWTLRDTTARQVVPCSGNTEMYDLYNPGPIYLASGGTGATWTQKNQVPSLNLSGAAATDSVLASNGSIWVAVNYGVGIYTSPDGVTWTQRLSNTNIQTVAWTGNQFIAGGFSSNITTSADGITWTSRFYTPGGANAFNKAFGVGGNMYLFGTQTANKLAYSTDYGITWSSSTQVSALIAPSGGYYVTGMAYNGSRYVLCATTSTLCYSTDGTTWSSTSVPATSLSGVVWNGSNFIASSGALGSDSVITSTDGIVWTSRATGSGANSVFSISSATSGRVVITTALGIYYGDSTGVNWTPVITKDDTTVTALGYSYLSVATANGITLGVSGNRVLMSPPNGNQQVF